MDLAWTASQVLIGISPHLSRNQPRVRTIKHGSTVINQALWDWRLNYCLADGSSETSVHPSKENAIRAHDGGTRVWRSLIKTKQLDVHSLSKILSITMRSPASNCWIQQPSADLSSRCWPDTSPYSEFVRFPTSFQTNGWYCFQYWWLSTFSRPGWIARFLKMICRNQFPRPRQRRQRKFQKKVLDLAVNKSQFNFFWPMLRDLCPSLQNKHSFQQSSAKNYRQPSPITIDQSLNHIIFIAFFPFKFLSGDCI